MKRLLLLTAVCSAALFLQTVARAESLPAAKPEQVGLSSDKLSRVDAAVRKLIDDKRIAGAVVAVARRGQVAHFVAFGRRDIESEKPMQTDTVFRIYSMSKPITTVAAMMLWEEGRFKLDDPVANTLPEFKNQKVYAGGNAESAEYVDAVRPMTVRDLMRHTSGLTYGLFASGTPVDSLYGKTNVLDRNTDLQTMVKKLGEMPLKYQPGTRFEYSVSTDVLGRLVEVWSNEPLDEFFRDRIFEPLEMHDTAFNVPQNLLDRFATNYGTSLDVVDAPATSRYRQDPSFLSGGGGLVSTADNYLRFCLMLFGGGQLNNSRILKESTVQLMTHNHIPEAALPIQLGLKRPGVGFGLGFSVRLQESEAEPAGRVGEFGWGGAASTHFWISPRDQLVVVALQQQMPYTDLLQNTVKPLVYDAILDSVSAN